MFLFVAVLQGEAMTRSKELWLEWQQKSDVRQRAESFEHWSKRLAEMTVDDVRELTVLRYLAESAKRYYAASDVVDHTSQVQQVARMELRSSIDRWGVASGQTTSPDEIKSWTRGWIPFGTGTVCDKCGAAISPASLTCGQCGAKR